MPEEASHTTEEHSAPEAPLPDHAPAHPHAPAPAPHPPPEEKGTTKTVYEPNKDKISGPISTLSFILTLPVLAAVVWLLYMKNYDCEDLLRLPKLQVGVGISLIFVFLLSNAVVYFRSRVPFPGLLVVMVPLIVLLTMGLSLVGAYNMESKAVPGSPIWLETKIQNDDNWDNIKSCIYDANVCRDLQTSTAAFKSYNFVTKKLSVIESGCCKPPRSCNMDYVNATFWVRHRDPENPNDGDCDTWTNDENKLCFGCDACKQGYTETLQSKWRKLGMFLIFISLLLILCHLLLFLSTMWERYRS